MYYYFKIYIFYPCVFSENNSSLSKAHLYDIVYILRKINRGTKLTLKQTGATVKCRGKIPLCTIRETLLSLQSELVARIAVRDVINV